MGVETIVPLGAFFFVFSIVAVVMFFRYRVRQELQLTIRKLIDSGQTLSAELLEELSAGLQVQRDDYRRGVISVAAGVAVVGFAFLVGEGEAVGPLLGIACFPFFVGLAHLFLWWRSRSQQTG